MKSSFLLVVFAGTLAVGCAGSNPLAPDALSSNSKSTAASSGSSGRRALLPPISPAGISCPSDAPLIAVGSLGRRMDIEFSEVTGARAYEIEITDSNGAQVRFQVEAPANRAEWYGTPGFYRVRVRTINCGGLGNWSVNVFHALHDIGVPGPEPPVSPPTSPECVETGCGPEPPQCIESGCEPPPPPEPQCMLGCF